MQKLITGYALIIYYRNYQRFYNKKTKFTLRMLFRNHARAYAQPSTNKLKQAYMSNTRKHKTTKATIKLIIHYTSNNQILFVYAYFFAYELMCFRLMFHKLIISFFHTYFETYGLIYKLISLKIGRRKWTYEDTPKTHKQPKISLNRHP